MEKKKTITLSMDEWFIILGWCKTYYTEAETEEELKWEKEYWETIDKLEKKIKSKRKKNG